MTSGYSVASTSAAGAVKPGQQLLAALAGGVSRLVDVEIAGREQVVADRADIAAHQTRAAEQPVRTGFADVLANLTPLQIGGIVVAGVLAVGLFAGWFR